MEGDLLGDKTWSTIFDNTKIKTIAKEYVPKVLYEDIAPTAVEYFLTNKKAQNIDQVFEKIYDEILTDYTK